MFAWGILTALVALASPEHLSAFDPHPPVPLEDWQWSARPVDVADPPGVRWSRVRLPDPLPWLDPAVFFREADPFEVWVGSERVYAYQDLAADDCSARIGFRWHVIPVAPSSGGQWLYVRSRYLSPGLSRRSTDVPRVGARSDHLLVMMRDSAPEALVGLTCIALGLIALSVYLARRTQHVYLYFAGYGLAAGLILLSVNPMEQLFIIDATEAMNVIRFVCRSIAPPMLLLFTASTLAGDPRWARRLAWGAAAVGVALNGADAAWHAPFHTPLELYLNAEYVLLVALAIVLATSAAIRKVRGALFLALAMAFEAFVAIQAAAILLRWAGGSIWYAQSELALLIAMGAALLRRFTGVFDQLQEEVHAQDEFLSIASHELRNPLAGISADVASLQAACPGGNAREHADAIGRHVQHLTRLVEDLFDVARVRHDKLSLRREVLQLDVALREAVESCQHAAGEKNVALCLELPREPVWANVDPTRFDQIAGNLVRNAIRYTPAGGHATVTLGREEGLAVLRVRDDGAGMTPETMSRLFVLFAQGEANGEGMGVGLALTRRLVQLHGGAVTASSAGPGAGSEFVVRLPACAAPARVPTPEPSPQPDGSGRSVLLIDDNANLRLSMRLLLETRGYLVSEAEDGRRGLDRLLAGSFDAAVVDLRMPEIDGLEVARQVRASPRGAAVKLVALTGHVLGDDRHRAERAGFNCVLVKPADPDELTRALAS